MERYSLLLAYFTFTLTLLSFSFFTHVVQGEKTWKNVGNYTITERRTIEEFRNIMGTELYSDFMRTDQYLIRWIRDQKFNLPDAKLKLLRSLKWRKENRIDRILEEDYSKIFRLCPYDVSTRDKDGRPILILNAGSCPIRKVALAGDLNTLKRVLYQAAEEMTSIVDSAQQDEGVNINDAISIVNADGFNIREHGCIKCFPLIAELLILYEEHYPDYLFRVFLINMPRIAETVVTFIQPFLSEKTKSVIKIYGYNKEEWSPELLKLISANQLYTQFGGTKKSINENISLTRITLQPKSPSSN